MLHNHTLRYRIRKIKSRFCDLIFAIALSTLPPSAISYLAHSMSGANVTFGFLHHRFWYWHRNSFRRYDEYNTLYFNWLGYVDTNKTVFYKGVCFYFILL